MANSIPKEINKILVIAPAWIGDMIMAQALFKFLKLTQPAVIIDVLAPAWTLALTERMPEVRQGIMLPFGHGQLQLIKRYAFARTLRKEKYDQVIVLPSSFKSGLIAFWAKIPVRTGWLGEWRVGILNDVKKLDKKALPLLIQRFMALTNLAKINLPEALEDFYPSLSVNQDNQQQLLKKLKLTDARPILAIAPGAEYGPAKRWPVEYFAEVAINMLNKGWQVWIFGSKKESELAIEIQKLTNDQCIDLTGKTTLLEALDLLALSKSVITNDSGLMHVAAALNRPLVVVYGSSTPKFTPPLAQQVSKVHLNLVCSPCFKRVCPLKHFDCMNQIKPNLVLDNLNRLLNHDQSITY